MNDIGNPLTIYHVEDDKVDYELIKKIVDDLGFEVDYQLFDDSFAFKKILDSDEAIPRRLLIILDISLPGLNGKDLLQLIRSDVRFSRAAVVMLSGSNSEKDLEFSLQHGCNGFVIKEARWSVFAPKCRHVLETWLSLLDQVFI